MWTIHQLPNTPVLLHLPNDSPPRAPHKGNTPSHNDAIDNSLPRSNPCKLEKIPRGRGDLTPSGHRSRSPGTLMAAAATRMATPRFRPRGPDLAEFDSRPASN